MAKNQISKIEKEIASLEDQLADFQKRLNSAVQNKDKDKISEFSKKIGEAEAAANQLREELSIRKQLKSAKEMVERADTEEMEQLAQEEVSELETRLREVRAEAYGEKAKSAVVEIRAGTGGEEAALFASNLYRMYTKFAESKGWSIELLDASQTTLGGFKTIIFKINSSEAYRLLKTESGVHRVQRVPTTESSGRIHTSTATVAVLPTKEAKEIKIRPQDIQVDVFRASGPGGQGVNTTDSAVRVTHTPTGIAAKTQRSRSQTKNREYAMEILRAKLYEEQKRKEREERGDMRMSQIGTGERSEKIRTYNFPQDRITDHRIKKSWHGIEKILDGDLKDIISALKEAEDV